MKNGRMACCATLLLLHLITLSLTATGQGQPDFAIVAPRTGQYAQIANSLYRVLLGRDQRATFQRIETLTQAASSQADVIVLAIERDVLTELEDDTLEALKNRKSLGSVMVLRCCSVGSV